MGAAKKGKVNKRALTIGELFAVRQYMTGASDFAKFLITEFDKGSYRLHQKNILSALVEFKEKYGNPK